MNSIPYSTDNTILFTLARMNPPTPGHLYLIRQLIEQAMEINVRTVNVVLSKTNDNRDDPIRCDLKISMLIGAARNMIQVLKTEMEKNASPENAAKIRAIDVIPICVPDTPRSTPFTVIGRLIGEMRERLEASKTKPNINLFIIIGDDRAELIDSISNFYYERDVNIFSINAKVLERENMETYKGMNLAELKTANMSEVPVGAFSATFVRKLVDHDLKAQFADVYRSYLAEEQIDELYDAIKHGIRSKAAAKKKATGKNTVTQKQSYPKMKSKHHINSQSQSQSSSPSRSPSSSTRKRQKT